MTHKNWTCCWLLVGAPSSPIADGGLHYRVGKNVQLDIGTGRGLGGTPSSSSTAAAWRCGFKTCEAA